MPSVEWVSFDMLILIHFCLNELNVKYYKNISSKILNLKSNCQSRYFMGVAFRTNCIYSIFMNLNALYFTLNVESAFISRCFRQINK